MICFGCVRSWNNIQRLRYSRWTKSSKPEKNREMPPRSPHVNAHYMWCRRIWFVLATHPNPWKKFRQSSPFCRWNRKKPCSKSETKPFFQRPFFCFISLFKSHLFFFTKTVRLSQRLCRKGPFHFQNRNVFSQKLFHFHQGFATSTKALPFSQSLLLTRPYLVFKG